MIIKKIFYNILAFVISIGLFSSCSYRDNQSSEKYSKSIVIKGNSLINVKSDTAILELISSTSGKNIINIISENNKITDSIVDTIEKLGVDKKEIYKSDCKLYLYKLYNIDTTISIKVRDINKIGEIVNKAIKSGASKNYNIEFTVSDYDKYYKEALKEAIEDGNNKAKALSKNLGVNLGSAIKIDEDDNYTDTNENNNFINANYKENSNLFRGDNKLITASVNMTFEYY